MAEGKWIPELTPDTPLADAARWVLARRLEVVRDSLGRALGGPERAVEHVHQLRVGTRRPGRALLGLARPLLSGLVRELEEAARQDPGDDEQLHRVRILGKRLRYAMEVFASCFAPPFRDQLYPAVEALQEILGHVNDSRVAS